jgi:hypothetical protein
MITSSSSRVFLVYPENRSFLLRQTIRPAFKERSQLLITRLLLLFVGSAIGLFMWLGPGWYEWHAMHAEGVNTIAQIVGEKDLNRGKKEVHYRFKAGDFYYTGWQVLTPQDYQYALAHGDALPVRYLSTNPETSWIHNTVNQDARWRNALTLLGGVGLLLTGGSALAAASVRTRNTRLARTGRLVRGELLTCDVRPAPALQIRLTLCYRFTSPESGRVIVKTQTLTRDGFPAHVQTAPGMHVAVLYRSDRHFTAL